MTEQKLQLVEDTVDEYMPNLERMVTLAGIMAQGVATVPKHLQGNESDCLAVCLQASAWGMSPYAVAQKTHLVNGTLGYEAQLVIAVLASSRAIAGGFKYEWNESGGDLLCRACAVLSGEKEATWSHWISMKAQTVKNSPLWKTDPQQQFAYLAAKKWARLYCPQVILGVYTPDELAEKDMGVAERVFSKDSPEEMLQKITSADDLVIKPATASKIDTIIIGAECDLESDSTSEATEPHYKAIDKILSDVVAAKSPQEVQEISDRNRDLSPEDKTRLVRASLKRNKELAKATQDD